MAQNVKEGSQKLQIANSYTISFDMVAIIILSNQDDDAIYLNAMHFKISSIYEHKKNHLQGQIYTVDIVLSSLDLTSDSAVCLLTSLHS